MKFDEMIADEIDENKNTNEDHQAQEAQETISIEAILLNDLFRVRLGNGRDPTQECRWKAVRTTFTCWEITSWLN